MSLRAVWYRTRKRHARQLGSLQGVRLLAVLGSGVAFAGSLEAAQQEGACAALRPQALAQKGAAAVARLMLTPIPGVASCLPPLCLAAELAHVRLAGAAGLPGCRPARNNMPV